MSSFPRTKLDLPLWWQSCVSLALFLWENLWARALLQDGLCQVTVSLIPLQCILVSLQRCLCHRPPRGKGQNDLIKPWALTQRFMRQESDSVIKSACYSSRGPGLGSQYLVAHDSLCLQLGGGEGWGPSSTQALRRLELETPPLGSGTWTLGLQVVVLLGKFMGSTALLEGGCMSLWVGPES